MPKATPVDAAIIEKPSPEPDQIVHALRYTSVQHAAILDLEKDSIQTLAVGSPTIVGCIIVTAVHREDVVGQRSLWAPDSVRRLSSRVLLSQREVRRASSLT